MGRFRDDQGQASVLLLFGLTLALLALTVLFVRVGGANDLRSQAQTAADAAALAAASALQDEAAEDLASGVFPMPVYDEDAATERAEEYARSNDAVLTDIRASDNTMGRNGNIVRVEVRGALCQKELEEDAGGEGWNDVVCDGEEEDVDTVTGNASAIAIVHPPDECDRDGQDLNCGGSAIDDVSGARALVDVNLVDEEGEYTFDPDAAVFASGATTSCGSLGVIPEACATHEIINEEFPGFYLSAGGFREEDGSDHGHGQAIDYMVAPMGAKPTDEMHQTALTVVNWAIENHQELGVKGLIYNREIWNPSRDPSGTFPGTGRPHGIGADNTQGHVDHIHLAIGPPPMR